MDLTMSRWFRVYDDVINEPKLLKLPEALRWQWLALLCIASKNGGKLPGNDDIALLLRVPEAKAAEVVTKLVKAKLFDAVDGGFVPHNWEGRQFKSDTSNDRVKKHRDGKRNVTPKQECDVTGTLHETAPEAEAEAEAKAETESEAEQSRADASAPIDEDLKRREAGLKAGIGAHFASRGQILPINMDRCLLWLTQGYATGTVLTAVETVLKRGRPVSTLEYFDGAIRDAHAKAPAAAAAEAVTSGLFRVFVVHGTPEWNAWQMVSGPRGTPTRERKDADGRIQVGWDFPTLWPEGFDEATGEKLPPTNAEDAA
jgi:hypothetical protein